MSSWAAAHSRVCKTPTTDRRLCFHVGKVPFGEGAKSSVSLVLIICYKYSLCLHTCICNFYYKDFPLHLLLRKVRKCTLSWCLHLKNQSELSKLKLITHISLLCYSHFKFPLTSHHLLFLVKNKFSKEGEMLF